MMSTIVVILALQILRPVVIRAGSSITRGRRGLDFENGVLDALTEYVLKSSIPDQSGKSGGVSYRFSNIRVKSFTRPSSRVSFVPGLGLRWSATNAAIDLDCDWTAMYKVWWLQVTRSGTLDASASGISWTVVLALRRDATGRLIITSTECEASVGQLDIDVHGDSVVSLLSKVFGHGTKEEMKNTIGKQMCKVFDSSEVVIQPGSRAERQFSTLLG